MHTAPQNITSAAAVLAAAAGASLLTGCIFMPAVSSGGSSNTYELGDTNAPAAAASVTITAPEALLQAAEGSSVDILIEEMEITHRAIVGEYCVADISLSLTEAGVEIFGGDVELVSTV